MDRRQRLCRERNGQDHCRMTRAALVLVACIFWPLLGAPAQASEIPLTERKSGYELMGPDIRAMQDDDTTNPAMFWVLDGETFWKRKDGAADKTCADCHGDAAVSMKGVAARYPAFSPARGRP